MRIRFAATIATTFLLCLIGCGGGGSGGDSSTPTLEATYTFDSDDTPLDMEDYNWPFGVASEVTVGGLDVSISKVSVQVNISHSFAWDLAIYLTSPANTKVLLSYRNPSNDGLPRRIHSQPAQARHPAAAAKWVAAKALAANPSAAKALPALKPNQPTQSMVAPIAV